MSINAVLSEVLKLSNAIEDTGQGYFHSNPLTTIDLVVNGVPFNERFQFGLFDIGLLAAITESPLRLPGYTDRGKTDYDRILFTALFGEREKGWHRVDVDTDFGDMTFSGQDFSVITDGKSSDELFFAKPWLKLPGVTWEECNRAPAKMLNKLLHIVEGLFYLANGEPVYSGHPYKREGEDQLYQFHLFTLNEGHSFHGTSPVDAALSRRQTLELPFDIFQTTMLDKLLMGEKRTGPLKVRNGHNNIESVLAVLNALDQVPISPEAEHLRLYLMSTGYCPHCIGGDKMSVAFSPQICNQVVEKDSTTGKPQTGCHYLANAAYPNEMCSNVYSIGDGTSIGLMTIARAYALIRAVKVIGVAAKYMEQAEKQVPATSLAAAARNYERTSFTKAIEKALKRDFRNDKEAIKAFVSYYISNLQVEPIDVQAVFPFVAYSKSRIVPAWVQRHYQGEQWYAVEDLGITAYQKTAEFHAAHPDIFANLRQGKDLTDSQETELAGAVANDIWLARSLAAYKERKLQTRVVKPQRRTISSLLSL